MLVRQGFTVLLNCEPDIEVVGQAMDGDDAVAELSPDVVLTAIRARDQRHRGGPADQGIARGHAKVLVLTTFSLDEYVYEALRAGASGLLLKDGSDEGLARGVRVVAAGDALLPGRHASDDRVLPRDRRSPPGGEGPLRQPDGTGGRSAGSHRTGPMNAVIAERLVVAEQTVETHVSRILLKQNLRDRNQATIYAYEPGPVRPGGRGGPPGRAPVRRLLP